LNFWYLTKTLDFGFGDMIGAAPGAAHAVVMVGLQLILIYVPKQAAAFLDCWYLDAVPFGAETDAVACAASTVGCLSVSSHVYTHVQPARYS
jgi:hypothetical protein